MKQEECDEYHDVSYSDMVDHENETIIRFKNGIRVGCRGKTTKQKELIGYDYDENARP